MSYISRKTQSDKIEEPISNCGVTMSTNNSTDADLGQTPSPTNFFSYAAFVLRFIAGFATIMNLCVLLLLVHLKKTFRNYTYWFQILVLSSEDLFNGLSSLLLTFFDLDFFRTSTIACSVMICAYAFAQIKNTTIGISCICVNRFRSILKIDKLQEPTFGYQQEIRFLSLLSSALCILHFHIWCSLYAVLQCPYVVLPHYSDQIFKLTNFCLRWDFLFH